jgi:hypothetical protein
MRLDPFTFSAELGMALLAIAICAVLIVVIFFLLFRGGRKKRLALRLVMSAVSVISLMLLLLRPEVLTVLPNSEALLVTPGAAVAEVNALSDSVGWNYLFSAGEAEDWKNVRHEVMGIPDAAYLGRHFPEVRTLHVAGHGLPDYDWHELKGVAIFPHFSRLSPGIDQIQWPRKAILGEKLRIHGSVVGLEAKSNWLYLEGPGGIVDSTELDFVEGVAQFQLQANPRETGRYFYRIFLTSPDGEHLINERLAVEVEEADPVKIIVLEHSPQFETKYLKNWLAGQGNAVAIRSAISKDRYRLDFLNLAQIDLHRLGKQILGSFDLLVIDKSTFDGFSPLERRQLVSAVEDGLGVLFRADTFEPAGNDRNRGFFSFSFRRFEDLDLRFVKPTLTSSTSERLSPIPFEPLEIEPTFGLMPIVKDDMDRILAGAYYRGDGLIGMSLIRDSYRWILQGDNEDYYAYWSGLISQLARSEEREDRWQIPATGSIFVDEPVELSLWTADVHPIGGVEPETGESDPIYLRQDPMEPNRWSGTFWPGEKGWYQVSGPTGKGEWFYAYARHAWKTRRQAQKILATKYRFGMNPPEISVEKRTGQTPKTIPPIWFFLLFLAGSAYLWVERKI